MFRKSPLSLSSSTPIRSSDRRKLLTTLSSPSQYPHVPLEILKHLVPDGVRLGNVRTSGEVDGVIYSEGGKDGEALWFVVGFEDDWSPNPGQGKGKGTTRTRSEKTYIPTLHTISKYLSLQPILEPSHFDPKTTPLISLLEIHNPPPPQWLTNGAPLFIPAIKNLYTPQFLPSLSYGDLILFITNPSQPSTPSQKHFTDQPQYHILGIGRFVSQHGTLQAAAEKFHKGREIIESGVKHNLGDTDIGRICDTVFMVGDSLWEMGGKEPLPYIAYASTTSPRGSASDSAKIENQTIGPFPEKQSQDADTTPLSNLHISDPDHSSTSSSLTPLSTSQIDSLLNLSLHQSLLTLLSQPTSPLPISSSTLYSSLILSNRPSSIPKSQRDEVVIGKSSWKKVGKWMKNVSDGKGGLGLIRAKEGKDGSWMILGINQDHHLLQTHKNHKTIAQEQAREAKERTSTNNSEGSGLPATDGMGGGGNGKGKAKEIEVEEFWRPANNGMMFWEGVGYDKNSHLTHHQILSTFNTYIATNNLPVPTDRATIYLDEALGRACGLFKNKKSGISEERVSMRKDEVVKGLKGEMVASVRIGGEGGAFKKGNLQPISIAVKPRGKKTVTIIHDFEVFGIDPADLAEELRRVCAGSASVDPLSGAPAAANKKEVMIQGSQTKAVVEILVARGVPKRWIKEESGKGK